MNIEITARNFTPSPNLKSFIEEKLLTLLKYNSHITSSKVVLLKEGRAKKVELILTSNKGNYITKCYTSIFEKTVINAVEKIKVQIKKFRKKYNYSKTNPKNKKPRYWRGLML